MSRIVNSVIRWAEGGYTVVDTRLSCLMAVRQWVENSFGGGYLYGGVPNRPNPPNPTWWGPNSPKVPAKFQQVSLSDLQPGDIVLNYTTSLPHGHVGIYVGDLGGRFPGQRLVAENTIGNRGIGGPGNPLYGRTYNALRLTPINRWDSISAIMRVKGDNKVATPGGSAAPVTVPGSSATPTTPAVPTAPPPSTQNPAPLPVPGPKNPPGPPTIQGPLYLFNVLYGNALGEEELRGYMTEFGPTATLVVIRKDRALQAQGAFPGVGPAVFSFYENVVDRGRQWIDIMKERYLTPESAANKRWYNRLDNWTRQEEDYVLPLPWVTSLSATITQDGTSEGRIEIQCPDPDLTQTLFRTLRNIQIFKQATVDVWYPVEATEDDPDTGTRRRRLALEPIYCGHIEDLRQSPHARKISFRLVPPATTISTKGMSAEQLAHITGGWQKARISDILIELQAASGIKIFGLAAGGLHGMPNLNTQINYSALGRTPRDCIFELVSSAGYKAQYLFGLEPLDALLKAINPKLGETKGVILVYNPAAYNPLGEAFWRFQAWTAIQPILEKAGLGARVGATGTINVFYPADFGQAKAELWAMNLKAWGHAPLFYALTALLGGADWKIDGYRDGQVSNFWLTLIKDTFPGIKAATKHTAAVLEIMELSCRSPGESDLTNPLQGSTTTGATALRKTMKAEDAAKLFGVQQQDDGSYKIQSAQGKVDYAPGDSVFVYYQKNWSHPYMAAAAVQPTGEGGDSRSAEDTISFYPYTVKLRIRATAGLRAGFPAVIVGYPPLDGCWETHQVEYDLEEGRQDTIVTLRTAREIYASYPALPTKADWLESIAPTDNGTQTPIADL